MPVCSEPGRRLFYEHVGHALDDGLVAAQRQRETKPQRRVADADRRCGTCGVRGSDVALAVTSGGNFACAAQLAISARHPKRQSASDPIVADGSETNVRMASGFAIAGRHAPNVLVCRNKLRRRSSGVDLRHSGERGVDPELLGHVLCADMTAPPCVVIRFRQEAGYAVPVTTGCTVRIAGGVEVNPRVTGTAGRDTALLHRGTLYAVDRRRVRELLGLLADLEVVDVAAIAAWRIGHRTDLDGRLRAYLRRHREVRETLFALPPQNGDLAVACTAKLGRIPGVEQFHAERQPEHMETVS